MFAWGKINVIMTISWGPTKILKEGRGSSREPHLDSSLAVDTVLEDVAGGL